MARAALQRRSAGPFGFNLIGFATANLGLGVALRNTAAVLEGLGMPFCVVDVDAGGGRSGHDLSLAAWIHNGSEPPPYAINLFHLNPPEMRLLIGHHDARLRTKERYNVALPFWELPDLPPSWVKVLETMDLVLAPSRFIEGALIRQLAATPVRYYPQYVPQPEPASPERSRWGMRPDTTVFLAGFDLASDPHRKNPRAALSAFALAFPRGEEDGAQLVIKLNNAGMNSRTAAAAAELRRAASAPGVSIVEAVLPFPELMSLYACADVYVSLHRGEGLGLGLMESMLLGKPVLATGWSGNMDFTDDDNACLVGHTLVPVARESPYHAQCEGVPQKWADPSHEEAALWMRRLAANRELRIEIGGRGQASLRRRLEDARKGEVFLGLRRIYRMGQAEVAGEPEAPKGAPRILLQNRSDNFLLPGGDSTVLACLESALRAVGAMAGVSLVPKPPLDDWDSVQLINITRATDTLFQLRNAGAQGRPAVLLPLYEDLDRYLVRATKVSLAYREVLRRGDKLLPEELLAFADRCNLASNPLETPFCREHGIGNQVQQAEILAGASLVLTSGVNETATLRSRFTFHAEVSEIQFGVAPEFRTADPGLFHRKYGLRDFALFVGRIETRKNPWTLIEIFRGLPDKRLVMIGFFEHPEWEAAVRAGLPANVTLMKRIPFPELVSAFAAARMHVLPSWYELPGLVSMEAAVAGCRVVTTSWGTAKDYFRDMAYYCEPDRPDTIRKAILEAWDSAPDRAFRDYARETFDWEKTARKLREIHLRLRDSQMPLSRRVAI